MDCLENKMEVPGVLWPSNSSQIDPWSLTPTTRPGASRSSCQIYHCHGTIGGFPTDDPPMFTDLGMKNIEKHWPFMTFLIPVGFCNKKTGQLGFLCHWLLGPSSAQGNLQPMTAPKVSTFLILFSATEVSPASSVFLTELKSDSHNFGGWTYVHCVCVCFILKIIAESCDKNLFEEKTCWILTPNLWSWAYLQVSPPWCAYLQVMAFWDVSWFFTQDFRQAQRKPTDSARCGTVKCVLYVW